VGKNVVKDLGRGGGDNYKGELKQPILSSG